VNEIHTSYYTVVVSDLQFKKKTSEIYFSFFYGVHQTFDVVFSEATSKTVQNVLTINALNLNIFWVFRFVSTIYKATFLIINV
jgi:hypothetical protein